MPEPVVLCPHCERPAETTLRIGDGPVLPFCQKPACTKARLDRMRQYARAQRERWRPDGEAPRG